MATLMHVSHDNGTIVTGEVMNWNVSAEDADKIIYAREKHYIERAIAQHNAMYDEALASHDPQNTLITNEIVKLQALLDDLQANPPRMQPDGRVSQYLSTYEKGSGYILADGNWSSI